MAAQKTKLKFNKSIISTSDKIIPTQELLHRLTILHDELMGLVQDQVDIKSLEKYREDLINKKLLKHRDTGVRAFTACCISDILRLYAPDAPYTEVQLTDFFKLVLQQFELLGDQENGYVVQQVYLLTRLLEYRSIVLITDLSKSQALINRLFEIFYNDSNTYIPKLYNIIGGILGEVISEYENISVDILKIIFNKFLTYNPSAIPKGLEVGSNCGYEISLILCKTYTSRMARYFTKYYSEILYSITNKDDNDINNDPEYIHSKSFQGNILEKIHKLTLKLWVILPELTSSVIGFLYHELGSEEELLRRKATKLVAEILSLESDVNFVETYPDTYNAWLLKIADSDPEVRVEWLRQIPSIISSCDTLSDDLSKAILKPLVDTDYKVRKEAILVFQKAPVIHIWKNIYLPSVYTSLLHLTREKARELRELCISTVGQFYSQSIQNIKRTVENKDIWKIVDTIPSVLFNLYYINDPNINEQVDIIVFKHLLPFESNDKLRVDNLLRVIYTLDQKAISSFFAFNKRQVQISLALTKLCDFIAILNNSETVIEDPELIELSFKKTIKWLSETMADADKVKNILELLKDINDSRINYLLKTSVKSDISYSTMNNCFKELLSKFSDQQLYKRYNIDSTYGITPKEISRTIEVLLFRAAPIIFNISNVNVLLTLKLEISSPKGKLKQRLLDEILQVSPTLFREQIILLKNIICVEGNTEESDEKLTKYEALKILYKTFKVIKGDVIDFDDNLFSNSLKDIALNGTPSMSKYATKILTQFPTAEDVLLDIKDTILPLNIKSNKNFTQHIVILTEIFKFLPKIFATESNDIVSYLIKEVLLSNIITGDDDDDSSWIDQIDLDKKDFSPLTAKLYVLKLLTNKLRSLIDSLDIDDSAKIFTTKTLKLMFYIISNGGELVAETNKKSYPTPNNFQTRLRCSAGLQILKLAKNHKLSLLITPSQVNILVNLVEDESIEVRTTFLKNLKEYISNELISIKFLPLVFFTAYEPDNTLKADTKMWINFLLNKESFKSGTYLERALPRLIHAIAHHSDIIEAFESDDEEKVLNALIGSIDYLIYYFDSVANQDNIDLLYYLSERVKNYQDRIIDDVDEDDEEEEDEDDGEDRESKRKEKIKEISKRMYMISELSQLILLQLKEKKNWQHSSYPGKLNLSSDLFLPFSSNKEARGILKTYIPDTYTVKVQNNIRTKVHRITHSSQTQRQRVQKKLLQTEYNEPVQKKNKNKNKKASKKRKHYDSEDSDDENYGSSKNNKVIAREGTRKNLRERKVVNYNDDTEEF